MRAEDIREGTLEVWRVALDVAPDGLAVLRGDLTPAERERAARRLSPAGRRRFEVAHAALRQVLASRLGLAPVEVPIRALPGGRPRLDLPGSRLRFNLAHSGELALVALARDRDVGVDVERLRPVRRVDALARRVLSERERAVLAAQSPAGREEAFLVAWTRKEAVLKALGQGLSGDPARVEVAFAPGRPARLLALAGAPGAEERWRLEDVALGPAYVGAVAYEGPQLALSLRMWSPDGSP